MEQKIFGLPAWVALVTLGAAGIVGYVIFIKNSTPSKDGGGTTGYSQQALAVMQNPDESATMALQNQLLSSIGVSINSIGGQLNDMSTADQAHFESLSSAMSNYANASAAQYSELMGAEVNPWVKQWYENKILSGLSPDQQTQYWNLMQLQAQGTPSPNQNPMTIA